MKLPLHLTLAYLHHLVTAVPIPGKYRIVLSRDYLNFASVACPPSQRIASTYNANTPPKVLSNPQFSSHQLLSLSTTPAVSHQAAEKTFNNGPIMPPEHLERSQALSAKFPLQSSYLLSLANPATVLVQQGSLFKAISTTDALAATPTSTLPYLRKADAMRYWANLRPRSSADGIESYDEMVVIDGLLMSGDTRIYAYGFSIEGIYCTESMFRARGHSDWLVCCILVLFVVGVGALEAVEMISDIQRCDEVYSEDDEEAAQPRYKIAVNGHGDEGSDTEVERFRFDISSSEKA
ncbi:hypothetical protein ACEPPN_012248 [Leptodophora sp. 'Broadleaf-Isolate-01']